MLTKTQKFKENYEKLVEERETLKKQHIKKHNIKLKYITDKTVFKIPCNGVIWDCHSVAMLHY